MKLPQNLQQLLDDYEVDTFPAFTSIGCYPILYVYEDSECICANCLNEKVAEEDVELSDLPTTYDVFYEGGAITCCECYEEIESAYGDPEENRILEAIANVTEYNNCFGRTKLFPKKYLNPYDKNKQLVTDEGCKLIYNYLAEEYEWYSDFDTKAIIKEYISVATVKSAIKAIEKQMQEGDHD